MTQNNLEFEYDELVKDFMELKRDLTNLVRKCAWSPNSDLWEIAISLRDKYELKL